MDDHRGTRVPHRIRLTGGLVTVKGPLQEGPFTILVGSRSTALRFPLEPQMPTFHPWLKTFSAPNYRNAPVDRSPVSTETDLVKPARTMSGCTRCVPG